MKKILTSILAVVMSFTLLFGYGTVLTSAADAALDEETAELKMIMIAMGFSLEDAENVEAAINEYIEPKIHATVDIQWLDFGEYMGQLFVKVASGEQLDLLPVFGIYLSSLYGMGGLNDLSDLVQTYGQDAIEAVGEDYLRSCEIDGGLYGVPAIHNFAHTSAYMYRTDIAEQLGLDFSGVKTMSDLTAVFEQAHAADPSITLIVCNNPSEGMLTKWDWDGLGDEYGVLVNPTQDTTVTNLYESEKYKEYVTLMHEWYEAGYVQIDAATCDQNLATLLSPGNALGSLVRTFPGDMEDQEGQVGADLDYVELDTPMATTNDVTDLILTIPTTAKYPEKAMAFLNLLYCDEYLINLLNYGIEGQDYRVIDEEKGIVDFLEGEDIMTCKYVNKLRIGNPLISYTEAADVEGINQMILDYNANADKSLALGFNYNSDNVANELVALSTVAAKYVRGLECGSLDPEAELPKFIDELKAAGIDTVIAEKQSQLDAWLAQ